MPGRSPHGWKGLPRGAQISVVLAVVMLIGIVVAVTVSNSERPSPAAAPADGTSAPDSTASSREQWLASICDPRTLRTTTLGSGRLPNSSDGANCIAATDHSVALVYGQYTSEALMHSGIDLFEALAVATLASADGTVFVFITLSAPQREGMATLAPLVHFGFHRYYTSRGGHWTPAPGG